MVLTDKQEGASMDVYIDGFVQVETDPGEADKGGCSHLTMKEVFQENRVIQAPAAAIKRGAQLRGSGWPVLNTIPAPPHPIWEGHFEQNLPGGTIPAPPSQYSGWMKGS